MQSLTFYQQLSKENYVLNVPNANRRYCKNEHNPTAYHVSFSLRRPELVAV